MQENPVDRLIGTGDVGRAVHAGAKRVIDVFYIHLAHKYGVGIPYLATRK